MLLAKYRRFYLKGVMKNRNRRTFVKDMLAAGMAPAFIPGAARGADGSVAPSNKITLGVIGAGAQGTGDMQAFLNHQDVEVVAVSDVNKLHLDRAKQIIKQRRNRDDVKAYHDFRELNADGKIDAVLMALPVHWHSLPALDAILHGKHIYHEKPMAMSFEESALVRAAVRKKKTVFQFGTQQRSDFRFRLLAALAQSGRLGKIQEVQVGVPGGLKSDTFPDQSVPDYVDWDRWVGPAPASPFHENRLKREFHEHITNFSLGMISCWGIHHLDCGTWANGTQDTGPVSVEGTGHFPDSGTCNAILNWRVRFEFSSAPPIVFSDESQHAHGVRVVGESMWVHSTRQTVTAKDRSFLLDPQNKEEALPVKLPMSKDHTRNFVDAIQGKTQTVAGIETAVRSDTLCLLALIAVKLGRKLKWDPQAEHFVNDVAANDLLKARSFRGDWKLPVV